MLSGTITVFDNWAWVSLVAGALYIGSVVIDGGRWLWARFGRRVAQRASPRRGLLFRLVGLALTLSLVSIGGLGWKIGLSAALVLVVVLIEWGTWKQSKQPTTAEISPQRPQAIAKSVGAPSVMEFPSAHEIRAPVGVLTDDADLGLRIHEQMVDDPDGLAAARARAAHRPKPAGRAELNRWLKETAQHIESEGARAAFVRLADSVKMKLATGASTVPDAHLREEMAHHLKVLNEIIEHLESGRLSDTSSPPPTHPMFAERARVIREHEKGAMFKARGGTAHDPGTEGLDNPVRQWWPESGRKHKLPLKAKAAQLVFWPNTIRDGYKFGEPEQRITEADLPAPVMSEGVMLLTVDRLFADGFSVTEHVSGADIVMVAVYAPPERADGMGTVVTHDEETEGRKVDRGRDAQESRDA